MDWVTFITGAAALTPFWRIQAMDGLNLGHYKPLENIAERLRETGLKMERAMYEATGGVNTHKGLIFAMSLLLGASGVVAGAVNLRDALPAEDILWTAGQMIAPRAERELDDIMRRGERGDALSHGERIYFSHGIGGVRREAAKGFPSVEAALGYLENAVNLGASYRDAALKALLFLMLRCEDTNVIHRGGLDFWKGEYAARVFEAELSFNPLEPADYEPIRVLDRLLIDRGVSPGGAADLLACTLFIYRSKISGNIK